VPQEGEKPAPASSLTNFKSIGYQRCRPEGLLSDGTIFLATSPKASFALVSEQGEITHRASLGDPMDRARHVVQRLMLAILLSHSGTFKRSLCPGAPHNRNCFRLPTHEGRASNQI
jgi:hypothetical protein